MELNTITKQKGTTPVRRVGRGGKRGKTSGRGGKGQSARAGNKRRPEWRDTIKRLPKRRGYGKKRSRTVVPYVPMAPVPLAKLAKFFQDGATVTPGSLAKAGLVHRISGKIPHVKLLGDAISMKLIFQNITASAGAKAAVEKAGGSFKA